MFCSFSVEPKNNKISFGVAPHSLFSSDFHQNLQSTYHISLSQSNAFSVNQNTSNVSNGINPTSNDKMQKSFPNISQTVHHITGGTKKRKWTSEEDFLLIQAVNIYGVDSWNLVSQRIENRSGKQCRERWMSNMCPSLIKDNWTHQEDLILIQKQKELGNKWTLIHNFLPGRSNTAIKNRWKCLCRRGVSKYNQEFKQLRSGPISNEKIMPPNRELNQMPQSDALLTSVQQPSKPQIITQEIIDSLFDGECWDELESTLSLKI